jgi:hypothetical protein
VAFIAGVPGIQTFINKNIEPLIFKLLWLCKNNSASELRQFSLTYLKVLTIIKILL